MKMGNNYKPEKKHFTEDTVLTFGVNEGKRLGDCPISYIHWIVNNFKDTTFSEYLKEMAYRYETRGEEDFYSWEDTCGDGWGYNEW